MKTYKPAIFFIVFLSAAIAGARDIYVSWQGTNNYPFTNWPDAATNIEWAVNVGVNGDTVWISNGTYYLTNQITVISNITICGNPGEQVVVDGCSAYRCFSLSLNTVTPVLSNLFITHGYCSSVGGGVYMYRGTLRDCVFSNNISLTNGGGVFMYYGTVQDCTFIDNKGWFGGGLASIGAGEAKLIDHCLFHTNIAYQGGGMYHDTAGSIITACVFTCNVASNKYGGIFLSGATTPNAVATHCTFASNVALAGSGGGGYAYKAYYTNCYVSNNIAYQGGAGLYLSGSVKNSVIARNQNLGLSYSYSGGGLYFSSGWAIDCIIEENTSSLGAGVILYNNGNLRNCLIRNNRASDKGGGVFWYDNNASISSCTIVSNYAAGGGGGLFAYPASPDRNRIENTIIYLNTGGASSNYYIQAGCQPTFTNCCLAPELSAGIENSNVITNNPQFVDKDSANWRLNRNSPCVNAGVNRDWMASAVDLDGHSRIDRFSGIVDMGCFEHIPSGTMFMIGIGQ